MRRSSFRLPSAVLAALYGGLGLLMAWPLPLNLARAIPGDGFDGWQNYWNLWWVRRSLLDLGVWPWRTQLLDYPAGVDLRFHTLNIPNGVLSLPVQLVAGLIPAYNFVVLLSFALSGLGTYLLALRVMRRGDTRARFAAFFGGAVYALSPFHFAHLLGHMQVFSLQWLPLYILVLTQSVEGAKVPDPGQRRRWAQVALAVVFLALASLTDWYNLVYLVILSLLWALWYGWGRLRRERDASVRIWKVIGAVWVVALLILSPFLVPMLAEARRNTYMVPDQGQILSLSADLLAFFLPQEMHPLWGERMASIASAFTASTSERMISLGIVPILLAGVAWLRGGNRSRIFVWATLAFGVLALGPVLHLGGSVVRLGGQPLPMPYLALYRVFPFLGIARSVGRFSVMVSLSVAVLAAMGLARLIRRPGPRSVIVAGLALGLLLLEYAPMPYPMSLPDVPGWYTALAQEPGDFAILNLPVNWDRPQYLLYQTAHGKPLIAGYTSRRNPESPVERYPGLQQLRSLSGDVLAFPDAPTFATIAGDLDLRYVVLDRYQMPGADERERTLELSESLLQGSPVVYQDDRLTVYRLTPPTEDHPYVYLSGAWGELEEGPDWVRRWRCPECTLVARSATGCELRVSWQCDGLSGETGVAGTSADSELTSVSSQCSFLEHATWAETCSR